MPCAANGVRPVVLQDLTQHHSRGVGKDRPRRAPAAPTVAKKMFMSSAAMPSADGMSGCRGRGISVASATARPQICETGHYQQSYATVSDLLGVRVRI